MALNFTSMLLAPIKLLQRSILSDENDFDFLPSFAKLRNKSDCSPHHLAEMIEIKLSNCPSHISALSLAQELSKINRAANYLVSASDFNDTEAPAQNIIITIKVYREGLVKKLYCPSSAQLSNDDIAKHICSALQKPINGSSNI